MAGRVGFDGAARQIDRKPTETPPFDAEMARRSGAQALRRPGVSKPDDLQKLRSTPANASIFRKTLARNIGRIFGPDFKKGHFPNGVTIEKKNGLTMITDPRKPDYAVSVTDEGARYWKPEGRSLNVLPEAAAGEAIRILKHAAVTAARDPHSFVGG
jgi:hypothetical protein